MIGVLGGSFDPVHDAHLALARRTLAQTPCTEVWFMPAARAVHKPGGAHASAADRKAMLELVLSDEPGLALCEVELEHGEPLRSLESMRRLQECWPDHGWYFILGEDSFLDLESWYQPEELFRLAPPVVAPRAGPSRERRSEYAGQPVIWLAGEEINLDSTSIRAELASGGSAAGLDPRVLEYIRSHGLYQEQLS